jgi:HAE1 family hydrophobic/amphiphilic exporter-1
VGIIELSTRRPVAITMLTIAVLLFGAVSLSRLEVTLLPDLSYPTLTRCAPSCSARRRPRSRRC